MRLQACASLLTPHAAWAALFMTAVASAATSTTTTLSSTGSNPYSLTATVTTTGLPRITGSVAFTDQTNGYTLNSSSLSAPVVTQSFLPPALVQGGQVCFSESSSTVCPSGWTAVAGDFNGDGKPDLALVNLLSATVTVTFGNGDGTFSQQVTSPAGLSGPQFVAGDLDNDGNLDLLTVSFETSTITVLFGNGNGSFTRQASTPTAGQVLPEGIAVADLNSDGKLDVTLRPASIGDPLRVYLGRGDGTFLTPLPYAVTPVPSYISFGDYNGDGKLDIAYIAYGIPATAGMYVGLGRGDGTFAEASQYPMIDDTDPDFPRKFTPIAKAQGDFNGDGKIDQLVGTNSPFFFMLGNGDGTFRRVLLGERIRNPLGNPGPMLPGDFNGDGKLDVLTTNVDGSASALMPGNGDGTIEVGANTFQRVGIRAVTVDLNGDGAPDVVGSLIDGSNLVAVVTMNRLVQTATATLSNANIIGSGLHNVTASYTGDPFHTQSASAPLPLAALRVATSLQLTPSATSVPFRGTVNLSAALNPRSAQNLAAGGLVTFTATGSPAPLGTASLNAQGVATLPNITLPLGANSVTAQYAGDTNFANANSAPVLVTVNPTGVAPANGLSCNGAYTGTFNGSITVLPGQYCEFSGGTVRGNLSSIGGVVVLLNTVVTGNVQILGPAALRGPAQHAICGSTVQGNVEVAGAFDPVMIGGTTAACGASRIGGNLQLQLNARQASLQVTNTAVGGNLEAQLNGGSLTLSGDTVSGNLSVQNNIGGVTVTGNRVSRNMEVQRNSPTAVVTSNQVTGNLQCSSNTGISGSGNTARQKQGQCAAF